MVEMTGLHATLNYLQLGCSDAFPAMLLVVVLVKWHRSIVSIPWKPSWEGSSLLAAWMTWFREMLHFFGVVPTCSSLCWLPAVMVAKELGLLQSGARCFPDALDDVDEV